MLRRLVIRNVTQRKKIESDNEGQLDHAKSNGIVTNIVRYEYCYGVAGLLLGLISLVGGLSLIFHGTVGSTSWSASILGFESHVNDAIPGVFLFVVGIFIVLITRPRVKIENINE